MPSASSLLSRKVQASYRGVLAPLRSLLRARNVLFILVLHWLCSELHGTISEHSKTAHKQHFRNLMTRMIKSHETAYHGTLTNAPINIHVLIPATYGYHLYMPREGGALQVWLESRSGQDPEQLHASLRGEAEGASRQSGKATRRHSLEDWQAEECQPPWKLGSSQGEWHSPLSPVTLVLDFRPPEPWGIHFCCLKSSILGICVPAALENYNFLYKQKITHSKIF